MYTSITFKHLFITDSHIIELYYCNDVIMYFID